MNLDEAPPDDTLLRVDPLVGARLGDFEVLGLLSTGGMGVVYRGVQPQIGKAVAIKVIRAELASSPEVPRMLEEARAVNAIGHPGIVDIFTFGTTPDGRPYLVMELLEGESLAEHLARRGPMPAAEVRAILELVLPPLEAAHQAGVIHRDLKPENVFLSHRHQQLQVKLLDFGLAKRTGPRTGEPQTRVGSFVGSPAYASPEQARAQSLTPASDLYSLGCVAFTLLTGRLPYPSQSPWEMMTLHSSAPTPSARELAPGVPEALDELVAQLMSKQPAARPQSARDVLDRLRVMAADDAAAAQRPTQQLSPPASAPRPVPAAAPAPAARASAPPPAPAPAPHASAPRRAAPPTVAPSAPEAAAVPPPAHSGAAERAHQGPVPRPDGTVPPTTEVDAAPPQPLPLPRTGSSAGQVAAVLGVFVATAVGVFVLLGRGVSLPEPEPIAPQNGSGAATTTAAPDDPPGKRSPPARSKATQAWLEDREAVLKLLELQEQRRVDVHMLRAELDGIDRARDQGQLEVATERLRALRQRLQH